MRPGLWIESGYAFRYCFVMAEKTPRRPCQERKAAHLVVRGNEDFSRWFIANVTCFRSGIGHSSKVILILDRHAVVKATETALDVDIARRKGLI